MVQYFFSPKGEGSFKWGIGPQVTLKTHTSDRTAGPGWGGGLAGVVFGGSGQWSYGAIGMQIWGKDDFSIFTLQPIVMYLLKSMPGAYIGYNNSITYNWNADDNAAVPLGSNLRQGRRLRKRRFHGPERGRLSPGRSPGRGAELAVEARGLIFFQLTPHSSLCSSSKGTTMKPTIRLATILVALTLGCAQQPAGEVADTVYTNGKIYTVNDAQPWAEAVAIKDRKFLVVGSSADVAAVTGDATEVVDLGGQFVMPGMIDTHTHPFMSAIQVLDQLVLDDPKSLEDIQQQVVAYAEANPDKEWIEGLAWPKGMFDRENPMREWLDEVVPDRPVALMDQGGHARWCNTKALEIAGFMDPGFEPPEFAIVERDENGVPSGTIRETAIGHLNKFLPTPAAEIYDQAAIFVQELFNRNGITGHRTAQGVEEGLRALHRAAERGDLSLHWAVSLDVNFFESRFSLEERMRQIDDRGKYASDYVGVDFAKIFVDGDLNGFGINMMEPFEGTTDEYGRTNIEPAELTRLVQLLDAKEVSVQFHAIGDQTIEYLVEALEAAAEANGGKLNTRHYPDHLGFITPDQIDRLVKLNGVIGFAPYFSFTFPGIHESYLQFVGQERLNRMQPMRTALDAGAIVGTGTDYSSLPQDPWPLLEGMTHRRNPWVGPDESEANNAAESISVEEAIHVYTMGGAYAMLAEDRIGSIEEGKYADFLVLDRNLLEIAVDDISDTDVLTTVFSGQVVYQKKGGQ